MDMVRPGFLLYGYTENNIGNKPILSIESQVISIINVKKNETVGYDRTFKTDKTTKVAIVPIGYADGFNRKLSNNFQILINDKKYCVVGRICMDVFMVDIGKDAVLVGDKVTILGKTKNQEITLNDHAERINTSPYDVICGFNYKRMNYISNNKSI
jgi:alanine racemase